MLINKENSLNWFLCENYRAWSQTAVGAVSRAQRHTRRKGEVYNRKSIFAEFDLDSFEFLQSQIKGHVPKVFRSAPSRHCALQNTAEVEILRGQIYSLDSFVELQILR